MNALQVLHHLLLTLLGPVIRCLGDSFGTTMPALQYADRHMLPRCKLMHANAALFGVSVLLQSALQCMKHIRHNTMQLTAVLFGLPVLL